MNIRIFFSSPGDVKLERETAKRIVDRLQSEIGAISSIEPYFWEHEVMVATKDYQENIPHMDDFDIVVCILWSRLGTPLDPQRHPKPGGGGFESGTEYEFFTAMKAHEVRGTPDIFVFRNVTEPRRPSRPKEVRESVDREIDRLDCFFDTYFQDETYFTRAINIYSTLGEFEEKLSIALRSYIIGKIPTLPSQASKSQKPTYHRQPYLGLASFDFDDAPVFFGRTAEVGSIVASFQSQEMEALQNPEIPPSHFIIILGSSGSGKSSLARAGVLPMLTKPGVIEGANEWRMAIFKPADVPSDPILALIQSLADPRALPELFADGTSPKEIADLIRVQPQGGGLLLRQALAQAGTIALNQQKHNLEEKHKLLISENREEDARVLRQRIDTLTSPAVRIALLADQLEELFTSDLSPDTLETFIGILIALANSGRIFVLATLRSDFYPRCLEHPNLVALMQGDGTFALPAPSASDIGQMIRQPAAIAGLTFEENVSTGEILDELLRDEAIKDPTALPLLSYTLEQLYEKRTSDGTLTLAAYHELGGLNGAIGSRAETVFNQLPSNAQAAFDSICKQLVTLQEGGQPTRRRAEYSTLTRSPEAKTLIDALVNARLLTADQLPTGERTISVAHEALLRHWPRLVSWVEENRIFLSTRSRVASRLSDWIEKNKSDDYLIPRGPNLAAAEAILANHLSSLEPIEIEFIGKSIDRVRKDDQRKLRNARLITAGAIVLCLIAIAGGIFALDAKRQAQKERNIAITQEKLANEAKAKANAGEARTAYLLGVQQLEEGNVKDGINALSQTLAMVPNHRGAIDRLYSQFLYGLPKAVPIRSVKFDAGDTQARQRISGASIGPTQYVSYLGNEKSVEVFDLTTRKVIPGPWEEEPDSFASVISNRSIAVWNIRNDFTTRTFNVKTKKANKLLKTDRKFNQLAVNSDGSLFIEALRDGKVNVYNTADGSIVHSWTQKGDVNHLGEDFSANRIICVSQSEIVIYDVKTKSHSAPISVDPDYVFVQTTIAIEQPYFATYSYHATDPWKHHKKINVHSTTDGKPIEIETPIETTSWVSEMRLNSSADTLYLALDDGIILPYSIPSGEALPSIELPSAVGKMTISPDDRLLVSSTLDGTVHIHDLASRKHAFELISHDSPLEDLGISWDGRYIITATKTHARIWDLAVGPALNLPVDVPSNPWSYAVDQTTNQLIASTAEGYRKFDLSTMSPINPLITNKEGVSSTIISQDASTIAEYSNGDTIAFHNTRSENFTEKPKIWKAGPETGYWHLSQDGSHFFWLEGDQLTVVETATAKPLGKVTKLSAPTNGNIYAAADNSFFATIIQPEHHLDNGNSIEVIALPDKSSRILSIPKFTIELAMISPDGNWIAGAGRYIGQAAENSVHLWDVRNPSAKPIKLPCRETIYQLEFNSSSSLLSIRTRDQAIEVWDVSTAKRVAKPIKITDRIPIHSLFSPDGTRIAILCQKDGKSYIQVWDWREQAPVTRSFMVDTKATVLHFTNNGSMIASIWPDPIDNSNNRHLFGQWEITPTDDVTKLLVALSEFTTADIVDAKGSTIPCDPFESWQKVTTIDPDSWFLQNPVTRTISPRSKATTREWLNYPSLPFVTMSSSMPAVGLIHASIAKWVQNDIINKRDHLRSLDPEKDKEEYDDYSNLIQTMTARVDRLVELANRNSYNDPDVHHALAVQARGNGELPRATELLKKALSIDPNHQPSLSTLAFIHEGEMEYKDAAKYFGKAHKLDPESAYTHSYYAVNLWRSGDKAAARKQFLSLIDNQNVPSLNRALIYNFTGDHKNAQIHFEKAATELTGDAPANFATMDALIYLITSDHYMGNFDRAVENYVKFIKLQPFAAVKKNLKFIYLGEEVVSALEKTLDLTLQKHPDLTPKSE